jgi:NitT/TauT family transport system substrate-binding protein
VAQWEKANEGDGVCNRDRVGACCCHHWLCCGERPTAHSYSPARALGHCCDDARPVATGGHPATLTMAMTGQIDIGRGAAPFGLDLVENGTIRIVARGSEMKERANETVRVCVANLQTSQHADLVARYMHAYRETIDWMYSDPAALAAYEEFSNVPARLMQKWRDEFFRKSAMSPDEIKGLDLVLEDVLKNKFIAAPLTSHQIADMIQIPPRQK